MKRAIKNTPGWGWSAFDVRLSPRFTAFMFLGEGGICEGETVIANLDLFLELQRDGRIHFDRRYTMPSQIHPAGHNN